MKSLIVLQKAIITYLKRITPFCLNLDHSDKKIMCVKKCANLDLINIA